MELLTGSLRNYSWGSRELMAGLRGEQVPSERPEAELWFGAHPAGSAFVGETPLVDIIAAAPERELGQRVVEQFGTRLPFLLKLLAAGEPLSLQAHPSLEQAQEGFARENEQGVPLTADHRNYKDDNHKPELIVALTEFEAMAGFRPLQETMELLADLDCPELDRYLAMVEDPAANEESDLRALFTTWITIPASSRESLIDALVASAQAAVTAGQLADWKLEALRNIIDLNDRYPQDVGVLGALLLNKFTLQPGEALYLDAGQLHAYVKGLGVEIMANSDNVLRGGLTPKHVDVPELVRVLKFNSLGNPKVTPVEAGEWSVYPTPIDEFRLSTTTVSTNAEVNSGGPAILLNVQGTVSLTCGDRSLELTPGTAAWIAASDDLVQITRTGGEPAKLFLAEV